MRGLYVNCDDSILLAGRALAAQYSVEFQFPEYVGEGKVVYCSNEWPEPPIASHESHVFIAYGWFVYKQEKNNLGQLLQDVLREGTSCLSQIEAGTFLIYWWDGQKASVITDPMGLSTHYIDTLASEITIAPSVKVLKDETVHSSNAHMISILSKKHHLFGNYTIYDGIERLTPGSVMSSDSITPYMTWSSDGATFDDVAKSTNQLTKYWPKSQRILPISSGLDSRYILANGTFEYGFTYGPENSPEIEISKQFSQDFTEYASYDFETPELHELEKEFLNESGFGVIKAIPRLLTNYVFVKQKFNNAMAFFDGYLGDLFQRGTYVNHKGLEGEILKIFPWVYRWLNWSGEKVLRKRYKQLTDEEMTLLVADYIQRTASLSLSEYQKITYYEFLYGRGGRYTAFGSNILAAQVFSVISPFASTKLFNTFIHQNYNDAVSYKSMHKLWKNIDKKYSDKKVESGYKPNSNVYLVPFIQIIYRLMFHLIPSRANYGVKLKRGKGK